MSVDTEKKENTITRRSFLRRGAAFFGGLGATSSGLFRPSPASAQPEQPLIVDDSPEVKLYLDAFNFDRARSLPVSFSSATSEGPLENQPFRLQRFPEGLITVPAEDILGVAKVRLESLDGSPINSSIQGGLVIGDGGLAGQRDVLRTNVFVRGNTDESIDLYQATWDILGDVDKSTLGKKIGAIGQNSEGVFEIGWMIPKGGTSLKVLVPNSSAIYEIKYGRSIYRSDRPERKLEFMLYNSNEARVKLEELKLYTLSEDEVLAQAG